MKQLLLDEYGDLEFRGGQFFYVEGLEAYQINIDTLLQTQQGEIYTDETIGLQWVDVLTRKDIDIGLKVTIIKQAILAKDFVEKIIDFSLDYYSDKRLGVIDMKIKLKDGSILESTKEVGV